MVLGDSFSYKCIGEVSGNLIREDPRSAVSVARGGLLHCAGMFIHRISITGCSDRGAWPWRLPLTSGVQTLD